MTIDNAISAIEMGQIQLEISQQPRSIALDIAIATMHKYQKIEQIMNELNGNFYGSYIKDRLTLEKIYEVIEDGECK
jgi:hypothetical protein